MSAVCAAPVFAATRRTAPVVTRAGKSDGAKAAGTTLNPIPQTLKP
jgi:hypothetical protein